MTTSWRRKHSSQAVPEATFSRSRLELMTQEMLLANFSREMHTNNSMEAGRRADGRATVAPHEQMQFISVSFPHFNTLPGRLLLGNPASLLHSCSAFLLPPPQPSRLHWGWEEAWPHVLPAVCRQRYCLFISTLKQVGAAQGGRWESRGHCIFWGMASSALPVSFCILTLARAGIGSP